MQRQMTQDKRVHDVTTHAFEPKRFKHRMHMCVVCGHDATTVFPVHKDHNEPIVVCLNRPAHANEPLRGYHCGFALPYTEYRRKALALGVHVY